MRWGRAEFLSHMLRRGVAVVGDDAFAVENASSPAVRVSLGAARNRAELSEALQFLAEALKLSVKTLQVV